ncbi:MAG: N-acetyltransferase, partial [archaeon]|nr:N-acetyltransferase [archaeon]
RDVPSDTVVMGTPAKPVYLRNEYDKKRDEWEKSS